MLHTLESRGDYDKVNGVTYDPLDDFVGWPLAILLTVVVLAMIIAAYCSFRMCRRPAAPPARAIPRGRNPVFVITMVHGATLEEPESVPPSYEQATQFPPMYDPPPYLQVLQRD